MSEKASNLPCQLAWTDLAKKLVLDGVRGEIGIDFVCTYSYNCGAIFGYDRFVNEQGVPYILERAVKGECLLLQVIEDQLDNRGKL